VRDQFKPVEQQGGGEPVKGRKACDHCKLAMSDSNITDQKHHLLRCDAFLHSAAAGVLAKSVGVVKAAMGALGVPEEQQGGSSAAGSSASHAAAGGHGWEGVADHSPTPATHAAVPPS
jgi:hypothetical protein